jgi:hypothetical protein
MGKDEGEAKLKAEEHLLVRPHDAAGLEVLLRSGKLVLGGFMGWDDRELFDMIEEDVKAVWAAGRSVGEVAGRMMALTEAGMAGLGNPVNVEGRFEVTVEEHKGLNVCPWECQEAIRKRVTTLRRLDSGKVLRWTDLGVHMIAKHGFLEGRGSAFRLEPAELVQVIFS